MPNPLPLFDILTPFMLEGGAVRGRVVRLGATAETILSRHDYPPHVARLLGELLLAAAMLSANLKSEGIFTIQVRGNGPVPLVVVDGVYGGQLRGFADVKPESRAAIEAFAEYSPRALVGEGAYLAITLDAGKQRYQGIVALEGDSIAEALTAYFTNSEQLEVRVQFAMERGEHWSAAGFMIERMPDVKNVADPQEIWNYAKAVAATVTRAELLDPLLDAPALLYRLFHEIGVWVYDPHSLSVGCRCSRERILGILTGMSLIDRADMVVDGKIDVHCQFCNKSEVFTPQDIGLSGQQ
jgi:molecular chaperone Hsp33